MAKWGMVIDLDRCTGCQSCVIACKSENNVPFVDEEQTRLGRGISWMEIVREIHGEGEGARASFTPRPCFHCEESPCTKVCPVQATYQAEEGLVSQNYGRCIGCRFCMAACPYTAKYFNWKDYNKEIPPVMKNMINPDVFVREKGVVEKCTFCHHRLQKAKDQAAFEGRPLAAGDYETACQQSCPTDAIIFGDLDDPDSDVLRLSRSNRAFRTMEELGTEPKVYYLEEGEPIEA